MVCGGRRAAAGLTMAVATLALSHNVRAQSTPSSGVDAPLVLVVESSARAIAGAALREALAEAMERPVVGLDDARALDARTVVSVWVARRAATYICVSGRNQSRIVSLDPRPRITIGWLVPHIVELLRDVSATQRVTAPQLLSWDGTRPPEGADAPPRTITPGHHGALEAAEGLGTPRPVPNE